MPGRYLRPSDQDEPAGPVRHFCVLFEGVHHRHLRRGEGQAHGAAHIHSRGACARVPCHFGQQTA
eukprot:427610-Prorocentrum_minimum.AAC.4